MDQNQPGQPMNQPQPPVNQPKSAMQTYLVPISIAFAGVIIAVAIILGQIYLSNKASGQNGAPGQGSGATAPAPAVNINNVNTTGEPFIGNANAPVTIAYWSDYQCPFCKQFELSTLPDLITNYVNKGELKIVFKDFSFLGPDSMADAEYARAVWNLYPSQFFAWRTAMFTTQPEENSLSVSANQAHLAEVAATIPGLDNGKIVQYITANQPALDKVINADMQEGQADGIQGTPSFIVGTQLLVGAEPITAFSPTIESELSAAK